MTGTETGDVLLDIRSVTKAFGGLKALDGVTMNLRAGIVTTLVGPNGAGKTTLFNLITGYLAPDAGRVQWLGDDILDLAPHVIARRGIGRSFQDLRLFDQMSVEENLLTAIEPYSLPFGFGRRPFPARRERVKEVMERVRLWKKRHTRALDLAFAERKFLSLARVMVSDSRLWLLDEPASGLDQASYDLFLDILRGAVKRGITICIIEHNLDIVVGISDRIAFLDRGRLLADGEPRSILANAELAAIYFGERRHD